MIKKILSVVIIWACVCAQAAETKFGNVHVLGTLTVDSGVTFSKTSTFNEVYMNTSPTLGSQTVGRMYWDSTNQTLAIDMTAPGGGNNVTQQVGLENYIRVINKTGSLITNGQAVYISGAQGQRPKIALAKADSHVTSKMIGIATHDIADNGEGFITTLGTVGSLNTSAYSDGDVLYLSAETAGALTKTPPASPNIVVQVGVCEYSNNSNGKIHVHVAEPMWADVSLSLASDTMTASSLAIKSYVDSHRNLTGTSVHGLGTMSTQAANNVSISGGSITGITDLAIADGGTGSSTAAAAIVAIGGKAANGFVDRTNSTLGMSGSNFQITTGSSYDVYSAGTKYTKSTTQSVAVDSDLTLHYVYFDTAGAIQVSKGTAWSITSDNVPIAMVFKDGNTYCISDERHGWKRDRDWHTWAHETIGARWHVGLAATFGDTTLSVTSGEIDDEDIHHAISTQLDSPRIWFRNSTTSMKVRPSGKKPYASLSGTDIAYDASGTLTQVTNNQYTCVYLYATNDQSYPLYIVAGQNQHTNIANARAEALPTIQLPTAEWKLLYKAIYKSNGASAPTYQEAADYRTTQTLALTATATDHQSLTNRDAANAHPQAAITGLTTSDTAVFLGLDLTNPLPVADGGTGATTAENARSSLGAEAAITAGTTAQYWRGDKSFQTLNQAAVSGLTTSDTPSFLGVNVTGSMPPANGIYRPTTNTLGIVTNSTERVRVDSSGNVGIGTSSPAITNNVFTILNVKGVANNTALITATSNDLGTSVQLYSGSSSSDNPAIAYQKNLRIGTATDSGIGGFSEKMRIDSSGNVIIGTDPGGSEKLRVGGDINIASGSVVKINGTQIITARQSAIADLSVSLTATDMDTDTKRATQLNTTNAKINSILSTMRTHGLIAP